MYVVVIFLGGTPPYLLHADIGYDVIEVDTDIHDRVVIIPCVVTNPNISVALYKINYEVKHFC